jgi:2-polyprenyl-3-methyl-5-hydroxy-6-metoxy-1,4-benzoquinol methylase
MSQPFVSALDLLRQEWDRRAAEDALHHSCPQRVEWTPQAFLDSGRALVERFVLADLATICSGGRGDLEPSKMRVLDLGCGAGRLLPALRARFAEVIGVDVSPAMLARAQAIAGGDGIKLRASDGMTLQCVHRLTFDFAICVDVLNHQPDPRIARYLLGQVQDRLRPGGVVKVEFDPAARATADVVRDVDASLDLAVEGDAMVDGRRWIVLRRPAP